MSKVSSVPRYRQPTEEEHKTIVNFLLKHHFLEYIKKQTSYFEPDQRECFDLDKYEKEILPNYFEQVIKGFGFEFRKICKHIGYKDKSGTNVSRLTKVLNFYLKEFCKEDIEPPIQIFFYHKTRTGKIVKSFECHLACADIGVQKNNRRYSYNIVPFKEPEEFQSPQIIVCNSDSQTKSLRETLQKEALEHLSEKLHNNGLNDYSPLVMEIGLLKKGEDEELAFRNLPNLHPEENFRYIRPVDKILEVGKTKSTEWFSRKGVFAADFDQGRVLIRTNRLQQLEELLRNNTVSLLCGNQATGKSVLILNLAYNLFNTGNRQIYYFDCAKYRTFDQSQLVDDIRSVEGFFFIENIHLELNKIQWVCSEFKYDSKRHILFTARLSGKKTNLALLDALPKMDRVELTPLEDVDKLIDLYSCHPDGFHISDVTKEQIQKDSSGSFKLLGYIVRGYTDSNGSGTSADWYAENVRRDLSLLERTNPAFPQILLALSPLYKNEVPTSEYFLMSAFGFELRDIKDLVYAGEITEQLTPDNHTMYGLPHSGIADAYWECGKNYIKIPKLRDYKKFLYDYVASDVPNGLEAVISLEQKMQSEVTKQLEISGNILKVIERECDSFAITKWLERFRHNYWFTPEFIRVLSEKAVSNRSFSIETGTWLKTIYDINQEAGLQFWNNLDKRKLGEMLSEAQASGIAVCILACQIVNQNFAYQLCECLDLKKIEKLINNTNVDEACGCFCAILGANKNAGLNLWKHLDQNELFKKLNAVENLFDLCYCLSRFFVDENVGSQMFRQVEIERIRHLVNQSSDLWQIGRAIGELYEASHPLCVEFCKLIDHNHFRKVLAERKQLSGGLYVLVQLCRADPYSAREIYESLDFNYLSDQILLADEAYNLCFALGTSLAIESEIARKIWRDIDKTRLMSTLPLIDEFVRFAFAVRVVSAFDEETGWKLWKSIDSKKIATTCEMICCTKLHETIENISSANSKAAAELVRSLDLPALAARFIHTENIVKICTLVNTIKKIDAKAAEEFCEMFNIQILADRITQKTQIADIGYCLSLIILANRHVACELCGKLDVHKLANIFINDTEFKEKKCFLTTVSNANLKIGHKLSKLVANSKPVNNSVIENKDKKNIDKVDGG